MSAPLHSPVPGIADLGDAIAAYALGGHAALDPAEARALEAHLSICADCRAELAELHRVAAGIGGHAMARTPPAHLREKVINSARATQAGAGTPSRPRSGAIVPWMVAAASIALVLASAFYAMMARQQASDALEGKSSADARVNTLQTQLNTLQTNVNALQTQLNTQARQLDIVNASDAIRVNLAAQPGAPNATARVVMSPTRGMVLTANHLPALAAGKTYQLWVVTKRAPVSIGTFGVAADGSVTGTMPIAEGAALDPVAIAVTIEPAGGVPAPTGPKVLVGALAH